MSGPQFPFMLRLSLLSKNHLCNRSGEIGRFTCNLSVMVDYETCPVAHPPTRLGLDPGYQGTPSTLGYPLCATLWVSQNVPANKWEGRIPNIRIVSWVQGDVRRIAMQLLPCCSGREGWTLLNQGGLLSTENETRTRTVRHSREQLLVYVQKPVCQMPQHVAHVH